jgi:hypothetical protein
VKHIRTTQAMRCRDCLASVTSGQRLKHVWSCPIATADRAQHADDLEWLANHPDASHRSRSPTSSERLSLKWMGFPQRVARRGEVWVRLAEPGCRLLLYVLDGAVIGGGADMESTGGGRGERLVW